MAISMDMPQMYEHAKTDRYYDMAFHTLYTCQNMYVMDSQLAVFETLL